MYVDTCLCGWHIQTCVYMYVYLQKISANLYVRVCTHRSRLLLIVIVVVAAVIVIVIIVIIVVIVAVVVVVVVDVVI